MTANMKFEIEKVPGLPRPLKSSAAAGAGNTGAAPESHTIDLSAPEGKAPLPPEPYTIAPYDVLRIQATGTLVDQPIDNYYLVESQGTVALGPAYGRVKIQGLSLVEAEKAIREQLNKVLRNPEVSVTLVRWQDRSKPPAPFPEPYTIAPGDMLDIRAIGTILDLPIDGFYVVEPEGTVALPPAYGRANVKGLSLVDAEKAIVETLKKVLQNPEVEVTLAKLADRSKPPIQPHRIAPGDILDIWANGTLVDQPIHGPYLVEGDGQVSLGPAYGRVNLKALTFQEAEGVVTKQLVQILRSPEVSITLGGWRKEQKAGSKVEENLPKRQSSTSRRPQPQAPSKAKIENALPGLPTEAGKKAGTGNSSLSPFEISTPWPWNEWERDFSPPQEEQETKKPAKSE